MYNILPFLDVLVLIDSSAVSTSVLCKEITVFKFLDTKLNYPKQHNFRIPFLYYATKLCLIFKSLRLKTGFLNCLVLKRGYNSCECLR